MDDQFYFDGFQVRLGPIYINDEGGKPFLAVYWRSKGIHTAGCDSIVVALELLAGREMERQIVAICVVDRATLGPICQFADPHADRYYRTAYDAHALRYAIEESYRNIKPPQMAEGGQADS